MEKKKHNPGFVTTSVCNARYNKLDTKVTEILYAVKGNPNVPGDLGLAGDVRDVKRDKKWTYALITFVALPTLFLLLNYLLKVGGL